MTARALTGRWAGYYVQKDQRRAITAELVQSGGRLEGSMFDSQTHFETSVYEMVAESGLPPGTDEQIVLKLREQFRDQAGPIRAVMTLPGESALAGHVRGPAVYFRKTYKGEAFNGYSVGAERVGVSVSGHSVHYRGTLSPDGESIEGAWWIDGDPEKGLRRCEGPFLLRRDGGG